MQVFLSSLLIIFAAMHASRATFNDILRPEQDFFLQVKDNERSKGDLIRIISFTLPY